MLYLGRSSTLFVRLRRVGREGREVVRERGREGEGVSTKLELVAN